MKNFLKVFILAAGLVLFLNVNSFANVDIAAYGGYTFSGSTKIDGNKTYDGDFKGPQFGLKAHYNLSLSDSIGLGLGGFYQYSKYKYYDFGNEKVTRNAAGVDVALFFMVSPEISPYIRVNYSFYDKIDWLFADMSGHGFGAGVGLEYAFDPSIRIFAELMYEGPTYTKYSVDVDLSATVVNVGLKYVIE